MLTGQVLHAVVLSSTRQNLYCGDQTADKIMLIMQLFILGRNGNHDSILSSKSIKTYKNF